MYLQGSQVGLEIINDFVKDDSRKRLDLSGTQVDLPVLDKVKETMLRTGRGQHLCLRGTNIGDDGLSYLGRIITGDFSLVSLELSFCNIFGSGRSMANFAAAIAPHPALEILDLGNNYLGNAPIASLASAMAESPRLRKVDLSENQIGDRGAIAVAAAMRQNPSIKRISLVNSQIGKVGTRALAASGRERNDLFLSGIKGYEDMKARLANPWSFTSLCEKLSTAACRA